MIDLTNKKFGRLRVIRFAYSTKTRQKKRVWECLCDCGEIAFIRGERLRTLSTQSCGCLHREKVREANITHGKTKHPLFHTWARLKQRCYNPRNLNYKWYGARGIKVCNRWLGSFENFLSDMGDRPESFSIERIDNNGDYTPDNCKWADASEQSRNNRHAKLSFQKMAQIKELKESGVSTKQLSELFGVKKTAINDVLSGKTWVR